MRTIQDMVQQEILCCISSIVSTLAQAAETFERRDRVPHRAFDALSELTEQAFELASPVPDYEEAAVQAGWVQHAEENWRHGTRTAVSPEEACGFDNLDPIDSEVYEHWAITDWFADKLIAQGEKVDKDFGALCIWARTTTGQAIYADGVVERIYAEMMQPVEA